MKKFILFNLLFICLTTICQANTYIDKGNGNVFVGIVVSSMGLTTTGNSMIASTAILPVLSSTTYNGRYDWSAEVDPDGSTVFVSTFSAFDTAKLNCNKEKAGSILSPEGRTMGSIYMKTGAGLSNLTTVYFWINIKE